MLARGVGNSSSAAALALKDKFGGGKAEPGGESRDEKAPRGGMGTLRLRLGMGLRGGRSSRKDIRSRPPVQHSDSIDSDEEEMLGGGLASGDASDATSASSIGGKQGANQGNRRGGGSGISAEDDENEYAIDSSSDEERSRKGDHGPRGSRRRGRLGKSAGATTDNFITDTSSEQVEEGLFKTRLRRLKPTSRTLRWPNKKKSRTLDKGKKGRLSAVKGGAQRSSPAAASTSSPDLSDSNSAGGSDFDGHQAESVGSSGSEAASATADKTSLLGSSNKLRSDNRLSGGNVRGMLARQERGRRRGDTKRAGTSPDSKIKGARGGGRAGLKEDGPAEVAPSSGSGLGRWLTPWRWRRFRSLKKEGTVGGEHNGAGVGMASASDAGRFAVGSAENMLYGWFGGVVAGRTWPGVGLADCPVFNGGKESATKVGCCRFFSPHRSMKQAIIRRAYLWYCCTRTVLLMMSLFHVSTNESIQPTEVLHYVFFNTNIAWCDGSL